MFFLSPVPVFMYLDCFGIFSKFLSSLKYNGISWHLACGAQNSAEKFQKSSPGYSRYSTDLVVSSSTGTIFFPYHCAGGSVHLVMDKRLANKAS